MVTAAHCVLDRAGQVSPPAVVPRYGVARTPSAVFVDLAYHQHPSVRLDAAVLVMSEPIPGAGAIIGTSLPPHGSLTVAGFQPVDTDGSLSAAQP